MTDKITKLLKQLSPKQLRLLRPVIQKVLANELDSLDIKALKGHNNLFRARVGSYRVVFKKSAGEATKLIAITKRDEKTYKNL